MKPPKLKPRRYEYCGFHGCGYTVESGCLFRFCPSCGTTWPKSQQEKREAREWNLHEGWNRRAGGRTKP